jgi:hypothetical protein
MISGARLCHNPLSITFSETPAILFFDQINLLDDQDKPVPLSYFAVSYDFTSLETQLPSCVAGEGSGTSQKRDGEVLKEASAYMVECGANGGKDRWGLRYAKTTENTVFAFLVNKTQKCKELAVGDQKIALPMQ